MSRINFLSDLNTVRGIVNVYQKSFGDEPWNEGYRCSLCETSFPLSFVAKRCPCCASKGEVSLLVEYWPKEKIFSDFYSEMNKPGSICVVRHGPMSRCGCEVIAFAWGYDITIDSESEKHLDAPSLGKLVSGTFFYLDECAVAPEFQGQGLGKLLVKEIFSEQPREQILLRTMNNSRMHKLILHLGGEVIMQISRDRVIMKLQVRKTKSPEY